MAEIKLKHYVIRKGKHGYWLPTPAMKRMGFQNVACGPDGPEAWAIAQEWENRYQRARRGLEDAPAGKVYPLNSTGDGFARFRQTNEWKTKPARTREDWERGWAYIDPVFGTDAPGTVTFEMLDKWYHHIVTKKGPGEAGRAMKIWRALYTILRSMKLVAGDDPSLGIRKIGVAGRTEIWSEGEVVRMVKQSIRDGYHGLACIIAIAWDTQFAPVDTRTLTPRQAMESEADMAFAIERGKTNEASFGIVSPRTRRLVEAYIASLPFELHEDAPMFWTRGYNPGARGGRPRAPAPYTKDSLVDDFADLRRKVFGPKEKRRLMDMRRSGAVEANAGGATVESIAAKMGNSIDRNRKLQKTYMPVNIPAVREADRARKIGRQKLALEQNEFKKLKLGNGKT